MAANKLIGVRVSDDQRRALDERAEREGKSLSAVVKDMIAGDDSTRMESNGEAGEGLRELPVGDLGPSTTAAQASRRARMSDEGLDELAASIRRIGVVQPLVVRPKALAAANQIPAPEELWQIVAGERRWLAAKRAGLATVPCVVREWNDEQTLQGQLVENLQREGLHELDEADGYRQLRLHGWDAARIARELGRSRSYVHARLRLLDLQEDVKRAFQEGRIVGTVARLLATVPRHMQPGALRLVDPDVLGRSPSTREAEELIDARCRRRLADAPFDAKAAGLGGKPPCGKCPRNSTVDRSLHHRKGVCTDLDCYAAKCEAHVEVELARRAADEGAEVIAATDADYSYGGRPARGRYYVDGEYDTEAMLLRANVENVALQPLLLPPQEVTDEEVTLVYRRDQVDALLPPPKPRPSRWEKERRAAAKRKDAAHKSLRANAALLTVDPGLSDEWAVLRLFVGHLLSRAPAHVCRDLEARHPAAKGKRGHDFAAACDPEALLLLGVDAVAADTSEMNDEALEALELAAKVFGFEPGAKQRKGRAKA